MLTCVRNKTHFPLSASALWLFNATLYVLIGTLFSTVLENNGTPVTHNATCSHFQGQIHVFRGDELRLRCDHMLLGLADMFITTVTHSTQYTITKVHYHKILAFYIIFKY